MHNFREPPFPVQEQLNNEAILSTIPNQPDIDSSQPAAEDFLGAELDTPILDDLSPHLWLVAAQSSERVDPLHRQKIKGRRVIITEDPKLHLVWYSDVIFIKPIPQCLLNFEFWRTFLCIPQDDKACSATFHNTRSALGFLRTYALLIRHPSDLYIAIEHHLIPENTQWVSFSKFIVQFRHLHDNDVSSRYHFGQLRLTRLNWALRIFHPKSSKDWWYYHEVYWNTGAYIERFFAPLLFLFGSVATVLTAMQVMVTLPEGSVVTRQQWATTAKASWGFSLAMIVLIAALWSACLGGILILLMAQAVYAAATRRKRTKTRSDVLRNE